MKVLLSPIEDIESGPRLRFGLRYSCTAFGAIAFTKAPEDWRTPRPDGPCASPRCSKPFQGIFQEKKIVYFL
jgi:hypothetical protein